MPKEITHWLIAETASRRIREKGEENTGTERRLSKEALDRYPALVRLGAIAHDVLYYVRRRPKKERSSSASQVIAPQIIADAMHGAGGEDPFISFRFLYPLAALAPTVSANTLLSNDVFPQNAALNGVLSARAFLFGLLTHCAADSVFHPLIYYRSGNFHETSANLRVWRNHRALESAMDIAFARSFGYSYANFSLTRDIQAHREEMRILLSAIASAQQDFFGTDIDCFDYMQGYQTLARYRRLMEHRLFNAALDAMETCAAGVITRLVRYSQSLAQIHSYLGLRYSRAQACRLPDTRALLRYRHPVSGEALESSLEELFEESVRRTLQIWNDMENKQIAAAENAPQAPLAYGLSLETGLRGVPVSAMRFFFAVEDDAEFVNFC
jgi:hypothetical protein